MKNEFDHTILLLQGGGALGAYQAGAYEGLVEAGLAPDWVVGISIGAFNAALIAGNPPERRVERLREFWRRVSSHAPLIPVPWLDPVRPMLNQLSASASILFGVPNFFSPRVPAPSFFTPNEGVERLSYYDTTPLRKTLEELADFDLVNRDQVRLSLGAVSLRTGQSVYFDNHKTRIGPDHVRASGALPPGLPPVKVDGDYYWDGGVVSNSPLMYVLENLPRMRALLIQLDIFQRSGDLPEDMDQVLRRNLDIRFSSRMPLSDEGITKLAEMKAALTRLLAKLPPSFKNDPDVRQLAPVLNVGEMTIARVTNRGLSHAGYSMDYEFSRATVQELWAAGLEDIRRSVTSIKSMHPTRIGCIARLYDLPPGGQSADIGETKTPSLSRKPKPSRRRSRDVTLRSNPENSPRSKRLARRAGPQPARLR
ncbi:MAG TPA: patatin-like phospholipase family protein [Clostridia bacterium]|nr:patatin-like phospholipase family protein [Clostridia bacterium]